MTDAAYDDEDWETAGARRQPKLDLVMLDDGSRELEPTEVIEFLERIAQGDGPTVTGLALGWSPARTKRFMKNPEYAEIIDALQDARHENAERAIYHHMMLGNSTAMRLYAFCQMPHRGWVDRKHVNVVGHERREIVVSVQAALSEKLGEIAHRGDEAVAAIHSAFLEPDIPVDDDIEDAEVISDRTDLGPGDTPDE
jgi:hypothetical protein